MVISWALPLVLLLLRAFADSSRTSRPSDADLVRYDLARRQRERDCALAEAANQRAEAAARDLAVSRRAAAHERAIAVQARAHAAEARAQAQAEADARSKAIAAAGSRAVAAARAKALAEAAAREAQVIPESTGVFGTWIADEASWAARRARERDVAPSTGMVGSWVGEVARSSATDSP